MTVKCEKCPMNKICICIPSTKECFVRKQSFNIAITEFAERMKKRYPLAENDLFTINDTLHRALDEIAEEMRCAE